MRYFNHRLVCYNSNSSESLVEQVEIKMFVIMYYYSFILAYYCPFTIGFKLKADLALFTLFLAGFMWIMLC